jgi:dTDP-4-amino-4,6-dideoxygalactose transaminase
LIRLFHSDQAAKQPILRLQDRLSALYPNSRALLVNRGRHALEIALRAFADIRPNACEVLYPGYICNSVIAAIHRCGLEPRPIDVQANLNIDPVLVADAISDRTLAVVAAHMYACPADIFNLEKICRDRGTFLVDDAAQVMGIKQDGRPLGAFGDVGILSFSQSKTVVAGSVNAGGVLLVNNPALINRVEQLWRFLPSGNYTWNDKWQFLRDSLWEPYLGRPYYYWSEMRRRWFSSQISGSSRPASHIAPATAALALHQLDRLDQRIAGRRRVAALFAEELLPLPSVRFPQYQENRYLTRIMLTMPDKNEIPALRSSLLRQGIQTRQAYHTVESGGKDLPNAMHFSAHGLELPSHSRMDRSNVKKIVDRLSLCLAD